MLIDLCAAYAASLFIAAVVNAIDLSLNQTDRGAEFYITTILTSGRRFLIRLIKARRRQQFALDIRIKAKREVAN